MPKIYEIRKEIGGFSEIHRIRWKTPKFGGAKNTVSQVGTVKLGKIDHVFNLKVKLKI